MLVAIGTGLFLAKNRKVMEIFPESVQTLWSKWQIRVMVLVSLSLQGILIVIGNRRKHSRRNWIRFFVWLAYLWADTVATTSLSLLSSNEGESAIMIFWAPFLLLHLGGPDTITAYSLEDNELWLRHLLGLVVQVGGVVYVYLKVWTSSELFFLAIPIFVAGVTKYAERTWVLRSASSEHFRGSMLTPPDPGPNYARFMEEYESKKGEGFEVCSKKNVPDAPTEEDYSHTADENSNIPEAAILHKAYYFFGIFRRLPADLILSFHDIKKSQSFFQNCSFDKAFKVIEVELGFMYDSFYTKAVLVHSLVGGFLRFISCSCIVAVFVAFLMIKKHRYLRVDVIITYILLVGAILLEIYALLVLASSDWTILWLTKHKNVGNMLYPFISLIPLPRYKRWSNAIGQYNLIRYCLKDKPVKRSFIQKISCIYKLREKHQYKNQEKVPPELKSFIFKELQRKTSRTDSGFGDLKNLCSRRGDWVLESAKLQQKDCNELKESITVEFDQSILLWHIATDLCYYSDRTICCYRSICREHCEASKLLSDYMLYLLVICPFMMPNGIGEIRFRDTCAEASEFVKERKSISNENQACMKLLEVNTEIPPSQVKGDRSKSVLFDACRLAKSLQSLENGKKWELVSQVWVEMLSYVASQCRWTNHAKQLRRGGELLTHVWLLMAHLGLTEKFQISQGHARVKLIIQ